MLRNWKFSPRENTTSELMEGVIRNRMDNFQHIITSGYLLITALIYHLSTGRY